MLSGDRVHVEIVPWRASTRGTTSSRDPEGHFMAEPSSGMSDCWMKTSASGTAGCVEVRFTDASILVRNSRDPHGGIREFTASEWEAFLVGAARGEFRFPGDVLSD
jgi:hypothetical protein